MPTVNPRVWAGILAVALNLLLPTDAYAASPEPGNPMYHGLRYNDDFLYLADPAKSSGPWDRFKYIPFDSGQYGGTYLSLGGELRERFESYVNPNFGIKAPANSAYVLQRSFLNADLHVTDYVRFFVQLGELDRLGNRGVASTTDIDHLELIQGFVDLRLPSPVGGAAMVRAGRRRMLPRRSAGTPCGARRTQMDCMAAEWFNTPIQTRSVVRESELTYRPVCAGASINT